MCVCVEGGGNQSLTDIELRVQSLMPERPRPLLSHCPPPDTHLDWKKRNTQI